jgi:hypothetical protein
MGLRIALVDALQADGWSGGSSKFEAVANCLEAVGHEVFLIDGTNLGDNTPSDRLGDNTPSDRTEPTLLTGLNRALAAKPMMDSYRTARRLAELQPDIIVGPLRGGLLQGALMARACGEAFAKTRIALWYNQSSRTRFLAGDNFSPPLAALLADALERQCLMLADTLIVPDGMTALAIPALDRDIPRHVASLHPLQPPAPGEAPSSIEEIVFIGPLRRSGGVVEFIEAIEALASKGDLGDRLVTFLGPVRDVSVGIGRAWLSLRAAAWSFRFRVVEESDRDRVRDYANVTSRLVVGISDDIDDLAFFKKCSPYSIALAPGRAIGVALAGRLEQSISARLNRKGLDTTRPDSGPHEGFGAWPDLILSLKTTQSSRPASSPLSVCILHHNRLTYLREAIASIPLEVDGQAVEIIVFDNASPIPDIAEEIRRVARNRPRLRVLTQSESISSAAAYNRCLASASNRTVLFLDDDNAFTSNGVLRLAGAIDAGGWDIVVSSLDVFDGESAMDAPSAGELIFLGMAHSAGLFFNAFGDTAMAVRRDRFLELGGFHDPGHHYPAFDWVTLARAQERGFRIGALQWPAVRYRRDTVLADLAPQKLDQEGARAYVLEVFGNSFDAELVSRYAQMLHIVDL